MRSLFAVLTTSLVLVACASQTHTPATSSTTTTPVAGAKIPQCYNADINKFVDAGTAANVSGVDVICQKTTDGNNAQWMSKKH